MSIHSPNSSVDRQSNRDSTEAATSDKVVAPPETKQKADSSQATAQGEGEKERPSVGEAKPDADGHSTSAHSKNITTEDLPGRSNTSRPKGFPVQVYTNESIGQKMSHWGPTIIGVISVVLSFYVWSSGKKLGEKQIELQREQVQTELADIRSKFFDDLTATDENKRTLAEIGLAGHGQKAMPVVHLTLGVEQGDIRKSGVNVVYRMFQAEMKPEGRSLLLEQLEQEFGSPNQYLRTGVIQSFVKIEPLLDQAERQRVTKFLKERVDPGRICSDEEGRNTIYQAALFTSDKNTDFSHLLAIIQCPRCGDAWLQAMFRLGAIKDKLSTQQRADLQQKVVEIRNEVLSHLRETVSDEDLATGGYANFIPKGQISIGFNDFKRRVEDEFDTLIQSFGDQ